MEDDHNRSLDPIRNISPELFDLIFQHLSPKELMRSSFVSREWHEEIGNSRSMRRIKLFIYDHTQEELNASLARLFSSQRKYRNISVNLGTMLFDEKVERLARESNAEYKNVKFSDAKLFDSLWPIEIIANNVHDLSLCNIFCRLECDARELIEFPNLRHLSLFQNTENINDLFRRCHKLKSLRYTDHKDATDTKLIERLLLNNLEIKSLCLRLKKSSHELLKVIPKCKFRLQKLSFPAHSINARMTHESRNLLCELLSSQRTCLEILAIDQWCGVNALKLIFNIETLKNLSFNINHFGESVNYVHINSNPAIRRIDISEMLENDSYVLGQVLQAVPNMVVYKTHILQYNDMMLLERRCPQLRELYVENFMVYALPPYSDTFSKLTKFRSLDINTEIVMLILAKEEEKRGHFERLILGNASWVCSFAY